MPNSEESIEFFAFNNMHPSSSVFVKINIIEYNEKVSQPKLYFNNKETLETEFNLGPL